MILSFDFHLENRKYFTDEDIYEATIHFIIFVFLIALFCSGITVYANFVLHI